MLPFCIIRCIVCLQYPKPVFTCLTEKIINNQIVNVLFQFLISKVTTMISIDGIRRNLRSIIDHTLARIEMVTHRYFPVPTSFPVKREHPMYHKVRCKMAACLVCLNFPAQSTPIVTSIYLQSHILYTPYTASHTSLTNSPDTSQTLLTPSPISITIFKKYLTCSSYANYVHLHLKQFIFPNPHCPESILNTLFIFLCMPAHPPSQILILLRYPLQIRVINL